MMSFLPGPKSYFRKGRNTSAKGSFWSYRMICKKPKKQRRWWDPQPHEMKAAFSWISLEQT